MYCLCLLPVICTVRQLHPSVLRIIGYSGWFIRVFIGITFADISNNIYVQIAMVMLIGLLAKNGILIVEFAIQRRRVGKSLVAAAVEGAKSQIKTNFNDIYRLYCRTYTTTFL